MTIRDARPGDAQRIAEIYNHAVAHTTAIWNDELVSVENRAAWIAQRQGDGFPVIVVADDLDEAVGYATYGPWRPHDGYRHTVEHSVYVRGDQRGRGLGRALMEALIARGRAQRMHVMIAAVESSNAASIGLHERLGFENTGTLHQVGEKFGGWLDLTFLQLVLDDRATPAG
ncbi:GNAT family N-acetyltransferase [Microbacterium gilvum]|uniref:GNAT family N-acetyltransferase n=1 Tax=Microbacterium gilvum TaxID=1336204 RepID=A0ABP8ZYS9_9MICO